MTLRGTRLTYVYTTGEEITDILTDTGFLDHIAGVSDLAEYMVTLCERATAKVNSYLLGKYEADQLASSVVIREIATYIAAYKLSIKGGEPELFLYQHTEAIEQLEMYRKGELYLDLPVRSSTLPVMQNSVVDNRFALKPLRVVGHTSSRLRPGQTPAYMPYFGWWD